MDKNTKEILLKILDIIDYPENKEQLINKFISACQQQALINLVESLPSNEQEVLRENLSKTKKQDEAQKILLEDFSQEKIFEALKETTKKAFEDYIKDILPSLTVTQRENLQKYLSSLSLPKAL